MKCEKCNHENSEYDIICENCGSPLNIEKNIELKLKYNNKQRAIDIDEIEIEDTEAVFEDTKKKVSKVLIVVFFFLIILFIIFGFNIYKDYNSSDVLNKYETFIENNSIGIIYIGNDEKANKYLEDCSLEYEYNYLYINQNDITNFKKNKIRERLKLDKINNTVVILNKKKMIDFYHNFNNDKIEDITAFLQEKKILPNKIGVAQEVIMEFENSLKSEDPIILYYSTVDTEGIRNNEKIIKMFCDNYSINYSFIDGNYLTEKQQLRLFQKIDYNNIQDEIIIIIDDSKVLDTIDESKDNNKEYFALFSSYGIIDSTSANSIKLINLEQTKALISNSQKNVILFTSDNCINCDEVKPIIGKISLQNEFKIYQYNISKNDINTPKYLNKLGLKEEYISTPLVIISENGKIVDYITGVSDKKMYEDTFKEWGIIR